MAVKKLNTIKFDDYSDLHKTYDYNKAKATRLAEAMTEVKTLTDRLAYLKSVLKDNKELEPFLWRTYEGEVIALHDIEDSHLKNIIGHITRNGGTVKPEIIAEARSRGIDPAEFTKKALAIEAEVYDDDYDYDYDDDYDDDTWG